MERAAGRTFYNPETGEIEYSTGSTRGGPPTQEQIGVTEGKPILDENGDQELDADGNPRWIVPPEPIMQDLRDVHFIEGFYRARDWYIDPATKQPIAKVDFPMDYPNGRKVAVGGILVVPDIPPDTVVEIRGQTVTVDDGTFEFEPENPGPYRVRFSCRGYRPSEVVLYGE